MAQRGNRGTAILFFFLTRRYMGESGQCHAPGALAPGMTGYPL